MLRILAFLEILITIFCLVLVVWPISGLCSGRHLGLDCESWFIFGVNIFGPFGLLAFVCAIWSLKSRKLLPQYFLLFGSVAILIYWFSHAL